MIAQFFETLGFSQEQVLIFMAGLSAATISITVWITLLHKDPGARRVKLIGAQREAMRANMVGPRRRQERLPTLGFMRRFVDRLNLLRSDQAGRISIKLMRAGWRSKDAIILYLFLKVALPFAFGATALALFYGLNLYNLATRPQGTSWWRRLSWIVSPSQ